MNKKNNYLTLSKLQLCPYEDENSELVKLYPACEMFDDRHDFIMGLLQSALAVMMVFTNERRLMSEYASGVRRPVAVSLIDVTDGCVIASSKFNVNIPKGELTKVIRIDLPFTYANIAPDHCYKVSVKDDLNKTILGESFLRMFDELRCGKHPKDWFAVEKAGISSCYADDVLYRSVEAIHMSYHKVKFYLTSHLREMPVVLPEVEVRIYFPNGDIKSDFCKIECDDWEMDVYRVEMPFLVHSQNSGICYAEILCMDYAFAGFVFCTEGQTVQDCWTGKNVWILDEYSPENAACRFRKSVISTQDVDDDSDLLNDEDFDRALDEFISSEQNVMDNNCNEVEGIGEVELPTDRIDNNTVDDNYSIVSDLDSLIGLDCVKKRLAVYEKIVKFNRFRESAGLSVVPIPLHAMFLGSPGTGKTTVAKMMGRMLAKAGVLSRGHVIVKERSTLLGHLYSMEETNTKKAIEEAQGGILLIDEAYQLCQPNDPRDPGKFVIETLMTALADENNRDWMLILAGYPDEMKCMFEMNPGLKSRFPQSNIYTFDDFSDTELMEIAENYFEVNGYMLTSGAREALRQRLHADYANRDKKFGNARHVINLIQTDIIPAMAVRVISDGCTTSLSLSEIQVCDIPPALKPVLPQRQRIGYCA